MPTTTNGPSSVAAERTFGRKITFSLGRGTVALQPRLVAQLVDSLRELATSDGDAVADEVSFLSTAGIRIDLRLSAAELRALADGITRMSPPSRPLDPSFVRLLDQLREQQAG
jgi:hypothetical protein